MRELRERANQIMAAACLILAIVLLCEFTGMVIRLNPFRGVTVPELPVLAAVTNSPAEGPGIGNATNLLAGALGRGTNKPAHLASTNAGLAQSGSKTNAPTNSVILAKSGEKSTTSIAQAEAPITGTNASRVAERTTAETATNGIDTNQMALAVTTTNSAAPGTSTNPAATNRLILAVLNSNSPASGSATNAATTNKTAMALANAIPPPGGAGIDAAKPRRRPPGGPMMPGMGGNRGANLPPAVQARIQQITDSELLAPVMHPLPKALLGIAGEVAFLRSDNGQTGMVKEGESLDDLKLLRIGVNRVLIEQDGQKKELMIFSGYGGESLLPTNTTNENDHP
jgi:hypothetical protein